MNVFFFERADALSGKREAVRAVVGKAKARCSAYVIQPEYLAEITS
jgi:hypothetical protein